MDRQDEEELKQQIREIENRCLKEQLNLIMQKTKAENMDIAYSLLTNYRSIWEFTNNVSTSGDSLVISLPKKQAKEHGIGKGTPVLIALKTLRFYEK